MTGNCALLLLIWFALSLRRHFFLKICNIFPRIDKSSKNQLSFFGMNIPLKTCMKTAFKSFCKCLLEYLVQCFEQCWYIKKSTTFLTDTTNVLDYGSHELLITRLYAVYVYRLIFWMKRCPIEFQSYAFLFFTSSAWSLLLLKITVLLIT